MKKKYHQRMLLSGLALLLTNCSLAPVYKQPIMPVPVSYKENIPWQLAKPTADLHQALWWQLFHDNALNTLEALLPSGNQNLKIMWARFAEARANAQIARAAYFPTLQSLVNADRQQLSRHVANKAPVTLYNDFLVGLDVTYEVDVWGRIRNTIAARESALQAQAEDVHAFSLTLQADLAINYFILQGDNSSQRVLDKTVIAYQKALTLTQRRHQGGIAPAAEVDLAKAQLESTKAQANDMRLKRAQLNHALAILIGEIPANVGDFFVNLSTKPIKIAPNLPSTLLERRPDIAAAEQRVKSANFQIGVARAAFYPTINLSGIGGFESHLLASLLSKSSLFWSLGPSNALTLTQPLANLVVFDGGKRRGVLNYAKARYLEIVANYRQTVLNAFQEVEDNLAGVHFLNQEITYQTQAFLAATRALTQARNRYVGGISTYLDAQRSPHLNNKKNK